MDVIHVVIGVSRVNYSFLLIPFYKCISLLSLAISLPVDGHVFMDNCDYQYML
jgi:hypothetical protein